MEHELKYSMLPPRLLADNYTSRRYKELGRLKLKAPKISCRGGGAASLLFRTSKVHDFQQGKQPETRRWRGKREREKEGGGGLTIIGTLPQLHASSKIVFNQGL